MTFKQKVYAEFMKLLNERIDSFQYALDELSISVSNETKSTAGDKHETALSMLQAEQSRMAEHLYEAVDAKTIFAQIDTGTHPGPAGSGSLVQTDRGYFFISVALPKVMIEGITIMAVSPRSPLGEKLHGAHTGDSVVVNGNTFHILSIT